MKDSQSFSITFLKKEKISKNVWNFYFKKPTGFRYFAGQYIKLKLPTEHPDNRGVMRYFTLSSSPTEEYLRITTHIVKSTFKMTLSNLDEGQEVEARGPWGDFVLHEKEKQNIVFLSGGIGLTPFRSMMKHATDMKLNLKIHHFMSYKTDLDVLFLDEFEKMEAENPNLSITVTVSKPSDTWVGNVGRITTELLHKNLASLANNLYYIAGPDPMIEGVQKILIAQKVKNTNILTDGFPGYTIHD